MEGGLKVSVRVDFFPELSDDALCALLRTRREQHPDRSTANLLTGLLPERLIHAVSTEAAEKSGKLAETIKAFNVVVTGSQGFAYAQSVSGGIPTGEVSADTCESKKMQGLYLTGEILDIDGECGGWNLQFAWSTGYLAGKHAAEAL
jgi:predicted flavoprotein YhiN